MYKYIESDGGASAVKEKLKLQKRDCVVRAIALACDLYYEDVYSQLEAQKAIGYYIRFSKNPTRKISTDPSRGNFFPDYNRYLSSIGWVYVKFKKPTTLGHLKIFEGSVILHMSKHLAAAINGTIYDMWDSRQEGRSKVFGYFMKK